MPTPLEPMERLSQNLGGPPLFIKRDDLTGLAFGGNKTRMLEFGMAPALEMNADAVVFGAAVQSNYCRQLAAACARLGLELHLLLRPEREVDRDQVTGNALVQRLLGAHVTVLESNDRERQQALIAERAAQLRAEGRRVFIPRQPDTIDLDVISYAESALEIVRQCNEAGIEPDLLYVAALDTTQAGLVLGLRALGSPIHVRGISPFGGATNRHEKMADMANQAAQRLELDLTLSPADFDNDDSWVGERYGVPTQAGLEAIRSVAQSEAILLDPVYTGKAMSALIAHIESGEVRGEKPVLFLHTGGTPALFGYADDVLSVL